MPSKREYLVSKGLAQPGRGRFNKAALAELERARASGVTFDDEKGAGSADADPDSSPGIAPSAPGPLKVVNLPKVRDITHMIGYTEEGTLVSSGICFKCSNHVSRCPCRGGIHPSSIVTRWDSEYAKYGQDLGSVIG